jgi:hypothetical protein
MFNDTITEAGYVASVNDVIFDRFCAGIARKTVCADRVGTGRPLLLNDIT